MPEQLASTSEEAFTDLANAKRFVERARSEFLFVHLWNRWLRYDGRRWAPDDACSVYEAAAEVARSFHVDASVTESRAEQEQLARHARQSQRRERLEAMVMLAAKAFPELKVLPGDLDREAWLLNVENGVVDLRTGKLRPHGREDRITKLVPVRYDPTATAPRWERFLVEVLPDPETRRFLRRAIGYSASGVTSEHVLDVLGDYAATLPPNLLLAKKVDQHPTELTTLVGRRFVSAIEAGHGRRWDEARVKWLTGGDRLTARGMRQDFFQFDPTHKLWVAANQKPRVRGTDAGIWARIKEVPFEQEFRDADDPAPDRQHLPVKDLELKEKLRSEYPGILRWIVEGCLEWKSEGLGVPAQVRQATDDYRAEEDVLRPFLEEYEPLSSGQVLLETITKDYREYAARAGDPPLGNRDMAAALRERGYDVRRGAKGKSTVRPRRVRVTMGDADSSLGSTRVRGETSSSESVTDAHLVTQSDGSADPEFP